MIIFRKNLKLSYDNLDGEFKQENGDENLVFRKTLELGDDKMILKTKAHDYMDFERC
jgi:hypothetical protein